MCSDSELPILYLSEQICCFIIRLFYFIKQVFRKIHITVDPTASTPITNTIGNSSGCVVTPKVVAVLTNSAINRSGKNGFRMIFD